MMLRGIGFSLKRRRRADKKVFLRWLFYFLILLFFYMLMSGGFFQRWQPILIIPFAMAVAMFEREFGSAVFGAFCGLMIDTACGNLFGMSSVWLMPAALAASLLVMNLIRLNFINHLWMVTVTCLIMAFMEYFFKHLIWDVPNSDVVLIMYIIPSYLSAVILSPAVYFLVKSVFSRFGDKERGQFSEIEDSDNDD
jgi:hypothetical protein